jgi:heme/copper-type cytochrome/quinol oxidase subunit 3
MEIPYEVTARPDTGLYNAKLGIWLFLASEVMLFGGLFSAYVFLRLGADPGYWPHGLLNVPVGMGNTFVLIASSVTVVLAWASLKMRKWRLYWWCMFATILCGVLFLGVKLGYEWPQKFEHFGVFIKQDSLPTYEPNLGNERRQKIGREVRKEISGHLEEAVIAIGGTDHKWTDVHTAGELNDLIEDVVNTLRGDRLKQLTDAKVTELKHDLNREEKAEVEAQVKAWAPEVKTKEVTLLLDEINAEPNSPANDRPVFWPRALSTATATIHGEDIESMSAFVPRHSSYFSTYFLITGLHGLHVLGGVIVFTYFLFWGKKLYLRNPEHMANRVEVAGLFWHFVDLVWIFVFPIFYLL